MTHDDHTHDGPADDAAALAPLVAALPRSLEPPHDLWPAIADRLGPPAAAATTRGASAFLARRWSTAAALAAGLALAALSSGATAWLLRRSEGAVAAAPAGLAPGEAAYQRTAAELARVLAARRGELAPATAATLARNLAIIDQAIAESRAALAHDPGNDDLVALLYASYEQKVALLRQAIDLPRKS
ncbi:MAG TPA: hypothetical protein VFS40_06205 [Gemmatimonadales bacterium]|nr:hypothetical protein [Gemmatimonadales bacterium]